MGWAEDGQEAGGNASAVTTQAKQRPVTLPERTLGFGAGCFGAGCFGAGCFGAAVSRLVISGLVISGLVISGRSKKVRTGAAAVVDLGRT